MADLADEIKRLTEQVAALTARVYRLEQKSGGAQPQRQPRQATLEPQREAPIPVPPPAGTILAPPSAETVSHAAPHVPQPIQAAPVLRPVSAKEQPDLEKKIGQYWLNRIGIVAMLIGVSYFLKYAFDNNWIGPGGRIAIGLLAGIGIVVWSETFRARGYAAFSYSLKAVGHRHALPIAVGSVSDLSPDSRVRGLCGDGDW